MDRLLNSGQDLAQEGRPFSIFTKEGALSAGIPVLLAAVAGFFYLYGLGHWSLWQDEANTALLAKNILQFGVPAVFDGKNLLWPNPMDVSPDRHLWIVWGWLPLYLNALTLKLLGLSTAAARVAQGFFGLMGLLWVYFLVNRSGLGRVTAAATAFLILFCVPLTLHIRQCAYYVYALFLPFGLFYALHMMEEDKPRWILFLACSLALVNTHLLTWGAAWGALFLSAFAFPSRLRRNLPLLLTALASALPFLWFYEAWHLAGRVGLHDGPFQDIGRRAWLYARFVTETVLPVELSAAVMFGGIMAWKNFAAGERRLVGAAAFFAVAALLLVAAVSRHVYNRYVIFIVPVIFLTVALVAARVYGRRPLWGAALGLLLFAFGVLGINDMPRGRFAFLPRFLRELSHDGTEVNEVLTDYLRRHAGPADVVLCNYEEFPLMFYTSCTIRGGAGGAGVAPSARDEAFGIRPVDRPRWVVYRTMWGDDYCGVSRVLKEHSYHPILLPAADIPWGNREDPYFHFYETPPVHRPFVLYRLDERESARKEKA